MFAVDESEEVDNGVNPFYSWAEIFEEFPADNKLKSMIFKIRMWEGVYPSVGEWISLLESIGPERFPRLERVHITAIFPGEDAPWPDKRREAFRNRIRSKSGDHPNAQSDLDPIVIQNLVDIVAELREEMGTTDGYHFEIGLEVEEDRSWCQGKGYKTIL